MEKSGRFQSDERRFARSRMKHVYEWKPWGGGEVAAVKGVGGAGRICFRTIFSVPPSKGVGRQE